MRRVLVTTLISVALFAQSGSASADRAKARELARLGRLSAEAGDVKGALRLYQKAIVRDPDYVKSYELAVPLWLRTGQGTEARRQLERLTLRCPSCAFAWYALGTLYRRDARFDLAVLAYEAYLAQRPKDPDGLFGLAMALQAQDDDRSLDVLQRYVALEHRPERVPFRRQAMRLIDRKRDGGGELPAEVLRLLAYLEPLRPWFDVLWRKASDVGDAANRESSQATRPTLR